MEALSGASSVLAVVSIAIQLAEGIHKLVKFCKAVQDAPAGLCDLVADLESLSQVLLQSQPIDKVAGIENFTTDALKSCEHTVSKLQKKLSQHSVDLQSPNRRRKLRGGFKFVLQEHEIQSLRVDIDRAKSNLLLVKANSLLYVADFHFQNQKQYALKVSQEIKQTTKQGLESVVEQIKSVQAMQLYGLNVTGFQDLNNIEEVTPAQINLVTHSCTYFKSQKLPQNCSKQELLVASKQDLGSPLWSLRRSARSKCVTRFDSSGSRSTRQEDIDYILYPSGLLRRLGLASGIWIRARSTTGWQYTIQSFNTVKETAPIFEFCRDGNLAAVQKLLELGEASVRDRDPLGRTPLWIAAQSLQAEVAELLLREGADPHVYDWRFNYPPICAIGVSSDSDVGKKISVISLFENYGFDGHEDMDILHLIGNLLLSYRPQKYMAMDISDRRRAALLLLRHLDRFLPKDDSYQSKILFGMLDFFYQQDILRWSLASIDGPIRENSENSAIHRAIGMKLLTLDPVSMEMIVRKTSDLHRFWKKQPDPIPPSTPTSLAMFRPEMFYAWVRLLRDLGHNIEGFVRSELMSSASPLPAEGWAQESLFELFNSEPIPNPVDTPPGYFACQRCGRVEGSSWTKIDLPWRRRLQSIRHRQNNHQSNKHHMDITLSLSTTELVEPEPSPDAYLISMQHLVETPEILPYSIVCSDECKDGICIAWVFEGDYVGEPCLPPYPYEKESESGLLSEQAPDIDGDDCPSRKMPGAFRD